MGDEEGSSLFRQIFNRIIFSKAFSPRLMMLCLMPEFSLVCCPIEKPNSLFRVNSRILSGIAPSKNILVSS